VIEMHTTRVTEEKVGGSKRDGRTELQTLLKFMILATYCDSGKPD